MDAFDLMWQDCDPGSVPEAGPVPGADVPLRERARFIEHPMLNPAQAEVMPAVLADDGNLIVVAPPASASP